jgi:hypothetical protein
MATLVTLTDYWSVHYGRLPAAEIVVNLDLVKTIKRLGAVAESNLHPAMLERTELWFGGYGPDNAETVLVTETPDEILEAAREAGQ